MAMLFHSHFPFYHCNWRIFRNSQSPRRSPIKIGNFRLQWEYRFIRIKANVFCRGGFDTSSNHPIPDTPRIDCVKIGSHLCVPSHWCGDWMDYLISYLAKRMKIRVEAEWEWLFLNNNSKPSTCGEERWDVVGACFKRCWVLIPFTSCEPSNHT